jgi:transposase
MKERRKYSEELKHEAIKMVNEQGLTQEETAMRLSLPKGTVGNWIAASKTNRHTAKPGEQSVADLCAENAKLRKELAEARMEREILKKAAAYFAKDSLPGTRS